MLITTRLNDWLSHRRTLRHERGAQRRLAAVLARPDLLSGSALPWASIVEQAVQDGADLTQTMTFPGHRERIPPLQFAVQTNLWWLQRSLLAAFSSDRTVPDTVAYVQGVLAGPRSDQDGLFPSAGEDALPLFAVALRRAQEALALGPDDPEPLAAIEAWLNAGVDVTLCVEGRTLLQAMSRHDASFAAWPVPLLARLGLDATGALGLGVLHTLWYEDVHGESVDGFLRLVQAGADPYLTDEHGNEPLHHLAQGLSEGTVKPLVLQRLIELAPTLDWWRPNAQGATLLSLVRQAAERVPPVARAQASLHAMAPLIEAAERAELEAALSEARTPHRTMGTSSQAFASLDDLDIEAPEHARGRQHRP